jgi:response regulator RpfG family c-di-GMP phosphodiesterase
MADMLEKQKHTILFVDDEENILRSLERLFRKEGYDILTANSGEEGLRKLDENGISVIVSDQRMPGMTGSEFLRRSRKISPDSIRIMLTGYADINATMDAINKGEVYRFITKPWDDDEIKLIIRDVLRYYELINENKRLFKLTQEQNAELLDLNQNLEKKVEERTQEIQLKNKKLEGLYKVVKSNLFDSIRVFGQLMEMYDPDLGGHCKRVAALSKTIAQQQGLDKKDCELIEIAAILHDIGLIGIPREILKQKEEELTQYQASIYRQHPVLGYLAFNSIKSLQQASILIRSHHENFNGSGYPDGLKNTGIHVGARIIHVASAYDEMIQKLGFSREVALSTLKKKSGYEFDPEIVFHFMDVLHNFNPVIGTEIVIPVSKLEPGMVLSRNLRTISDRLLMVANTVIHQAHIEKIYNFNRIDPIDGGVYIYKKDLAKQD